MGIAGIHIVGFQLWVGVETAFEALFLALLCANVV